MAAPSSRAIGSRICRAYPRERHSQAHPCHRSVPRGAQTHVTSAGARPAYRIPASAHRPQPAAPGFVCAPGPALRWHVRRWTRQRDARASRSIRPRQGAGLSWLSSGTGRAGGAFERRGGNCSRPAGPSQLRQAAVDVVPARAGCALDRRLRRRTGNPARGHGTGRCGPASKLAKERGARCNRFFAAETELCVPDIIYDVAIIGAGPAGYTAAIRGAEYGLKVALIEKGDRLGGTCLLVGCIPTKAMLFNAEIWDHLKHAAEYGIDGIGTPALNWGAVMKRKDSIVTRHVKGLEFLMRKHKITTIEAYARLTGPAKDGIHTLDIFTEGGGGAAGETSQLKAKNIIVATGSEAKLLPGLEADSRILTNIEILSLSEPPKSLVVIGAGAVGVEFSSIYRSFGSEVTILEFLPRIVPVEDEEISKELTRVFKKHGIDVNTGAKVEKVEKTDAGAKVAYTDANGKPQVKEAEKVLIAVG